MRTAPLAALAALLISPLAHADKFWLDTPNAKEQAVADSRPDVLVGVVLDQDADYYHLRVAGGEVWLQKSRVVKVEADGLTVAGIEQQEAGDAARLAAAEQERERDQAQWQEASASRRAQAAEASFDRSEGQPAPVQQPEAVYDPVLQVSGSGIGYQALLRDLELAYRLTGDRRYIKSLRVMRRMQ